MSQFPSPYSPPPIDFSQFSPPGNLLQPARRAGTLVMVIGVLIALFGACNGGQALVLSPEDIAQQQAELRKLGLPTEPSVSSEAIRTINLIGGVLVLLVGVGFIVNGAYVRRGSGVAAIVGLILTGGLAFLAGLLVLMFVLVAFVAPPFAAFACVFVVPLALLIWAFVWLLPAARQGSRGAAAQQYQAQFYQYWQQQQAYAQPPGYSMPYGAQGYGNPTGPAPAPQGYNAPTGQAWSQATTAPPPNPGGSAEASPDPGTPRPPEG